jgi:hypothetical protein
VGRSGQAPGEKLAAASDPLWLLPDEHEAAKASVTRGIATEALRESIGTLCTAGPGAATGLVGERSLSSDANRETTLSRSDS